MCPFRKCVNGRILLLCNKIQAKAINSWKTCQGKKGKLKFTPDELRKVIQTYHKYLKKSLWRLVDVIDYTEFYRHTVNPLIEYSNMVVYGTSEFLMIARRYVEKILFRKGKGEMIAFRSYNLKQFSTVRFSEGERDIWELYVRGIRYLANTYGIYNIHIAEPFFNVMTLVYGKDSIALSVIQ